MTDKSGYTGFPGGLLQPVGCAAGDRWEVAAREQPARVGGARFAKLLT